MADNTVVCSPYRCFEMTDNEAGYPQCKSGPYELVEQAKAAAHTAGISTQLFVSCAMLSLP